MWLLKNKLVVRVYGLNIAEVKRILRNILGESWLLIWVFRNGKGLGAQTWGVGILGRGAVGKKLEK